MRVEAVVGYDDSGFPKWGWAWVAGLSLFCDPTVVPHPYITHLHNVRHMGGGLINEWGRR